MRLIDADEVLKRWGLKFYAMGGDRLGPNGDDISFYVNGLLNEIQNAPTVELRMVNGVIIPIERPQGEWIKHSTYKDVLICSKCNHGSNQVYDTFNFCPNCGAKMTKEAENECKNDT